MCGIVGIMARQVAGFNAYHVDIFKELIFANEVRGAHGTGMFWNVGARCKTLKAPMPSSSFIHDSKVKDGFHEIYQKSSFAIGHNRHATKGGLDIESTHPFRVGHITLIHNGTLHSHKHMKDVAVDSEAITHSIAELGAIPTLEKLDGAFALVWYDSDTKLLNFIRNDERPLHLITTTASWVISSEAKMADWIISRNKGFIQSITPIPVGLLHQYSIEDFTIKTEQVKIRPKDIYPDYWGATMGNGSYKYYPPANPNRPINQKDLPKPTIPDIAPPATEKPVTFAYKLGDQIVFSPIQIISSGNTHYLDGIIEDDGPDSLEVRFYNGNKKELQELLKETLIRGTIMQVYWRGGEERYVLKNVKPVPALSNVIPLLVN